MTAWSALKKRSISRRASRRPSPWPSPPSAGRRSQWRQHLFGAAWAEITHRAAGGQSSGRIQSRTVAPWHMHHDCLSGLRRQVGRDAATNTNLPAKAPSPLRSAGASLQNRPLAKRADGGAGRRERLQADAVGSHPGLGQGNKRRLEVGTPSPQPSPPMGERERRWSEGVGGAAGWGG